MNGPREKTEKMDWGFLVDDLGRNDDFNFPPESWFDECELDALENGDIEL
jgi:hypothetical protein